MNASSVITFYCVVLVVLLAVKEKT